MVKELLEEFWQAAQNSWNLGDDMRPSEPGLLFDQYVELQMLLWKALVESFVVADAADGADHDWRIDLPLEERAIRDPERPHRLRGRFQ